MKRMVWWLGTVRVWCVSCKKGKEDNLLIKRTTISTPLQLSWVSFIASSSYISIWPNALYTWAHLLDS